jgi:RNA-binding protein YhbY
MKGKRGKELRAAGQKTAATMFVGSDGLTDGVVAEAKAQLKKRALLKLKVAREAADAAGGMKGLGEVLAEKAGADFVEARGLTVLLARKDRR